MFRDELERIEAADYSGSDLNQLRTDLATLIGIAFDELSERIAKLETQAGRQP